MTVDKIERLVDNVNHPAHYVGKIETIEYLKDKMSPDMFEGYCVGNVLKYVSRYKKKNGLEDLRKAQWYLNEIIDVLSEDEAIKQLYKNTICVHHMTSNWKEDNNNEINRYR